MSRHVDPQVRAAGEAAQWLVRCQTGEADATALAHWRAADPLHEQAWLRAERVLASLGMAHGSLGAAALRQSDRAGRRRAVRLLTLLLVAAPSGWLAWQQMPTGAWRGDESTARGERRLLALPDGGSLWLDTASVVAIVYQADQRVVILREGALQVQTAPDAAGRPFLVRTSQGSIQALGTRFSVRLFEAEGGQPAFTRVGVSEGAVLLRTENGVEQRLEAGQQTDLRAVEISAPRALSANQAGWAEGVLYAESMSLMQFVRELGRYRPGVLRCDRAVAHLRVSGAFQLADTDAALRALTLSLPVRVVERTRYWVTVVGWLGPSA